MSPFYSDVKRSEEQTKTWNTDSCSANNPCYYYCGYYRCIHFSGRGNLSNLILFISFHLYVFLYSDLWIHGRVIGSQRSGLTSLIQTPTSHSSRRQEEQRKEARDGWVSAAAARRCETSWSLENCHHSRTGNGAETNILNAQLLLAARSAGNSLLILHLLSITGTNKSGGWAGIPFRPNGQEVIH